MTRVDAPNRSAAAQERKRLAILAARKSRSDVPNELELHTIKAAPNLFQPRHDSIAYAPGRSEAHIKALAKTPKGGAGLDPLTIVAMGDEWFLVDGHHRLAAYKEAGWQKAVPVCILSSDLVAEQRVEWAVQLSYADNKKDRLNLNGADKLDGAWRSVAGSADMSIADTATTHGVSPRSVASMRRVKKELEDEGMRPSLMASWRMAQLELQNRQGKERQNGSDWQEAQRRELSKRLRAAMDMQPSAEQLAAVLEAYVPGIVMAMSLIPDDSEADGGEDF